MAKILIIEDDPQLSATVGEHLNFEHHQVEIVTDGAAGLARLRAYDYDVIIMDWMLPGASGVDICKTYRAEGGKSPVLMLTGKNKISDKEAGFGAGVDDYLTKPFHMKELSMRVQALLRRVGGGFTTNVLRIGPVTLDPESFRVKRGDEEVRLAPKEFAILEFLMRHPGVVFSPEAMLSRIWLADEEPSPDIVRTHIKNLRKKLSGEDDTSIIHTVHGVGYKVDEPR